MNREELSYRQSTRALILDNKGRILIVQKNSFKENEWDMPGGGVEEKEDPKVTILRELAEELGCNKFEIIKTSKKIDRYEWPDEFINKRIAENKPIYQGQERAQFLVKFLGEEVDLKPQAEEIRAVKWVYPKELSEYLVFPNQLNKMEALLKEFEVELNSE